ncbi:hypothetical protein F4819DRAFT_447197 [Hypoxylon fuscum]|nr:hypothetical protein F4819DRAFT_447197 [Hypoxylon fuscum]
MRAIFSLTLSSFAYVSARLGVEDTNIEECRFARKHGDISFGILYTGSRIVTARSMFASDGQGLSRNWIVVCRGQPLEPGISTGMHNMEPCTFYVRLDARGRSQTTGSSLPQGVVHLHNSATKPCSEW